MPDNAADTTRGLVEWYGSQAAAARALDVPRRTVRGWAAGKLPRGGWSWLTDILREVDRAGRVAEVGQQRASSLPPVGGGAVMRGTEDRRVSIGEYLHPGTVDRVRELYLGGSDAQELARAFHAGINDGGFYADTFDPDSEQGFWDIYEMDLDEGEIFGGFLYG